MIYDTSTGSPTRALIAAFPGIWIRDDGAFHHEETGVRWQPGDVEFAEPYQRGVVTMHGLCCFGPSETMGQGPKLRAAT